MSHTQDDLLNVLRKHIDDSLASEGITPHILSCVMLDVSYSPVIAHAGGRYEDAVEVKPYGFFPDDVLPDRFDVCGEVVDRESLKVMRARYLLRRGEHFGPAMERFRVRMTRPTSDGLPREDERR